MKPCLNGHTGGRDKWRQCIECKADRDRNRRGPSTRAAWTARNAKREADKLKATPAWADLFAIGLIYQRARELTEQTGIPHEVDHVVPLRHPLVCGLHVEGNLQVLTAAANNKKNNTWAG